MKSLEFIQQVASGNASDAKDTLSNLLSGMAFEALSNKKQEIAKSIFNEPQVQEEEVSDPLIAEGKRIVFKHEPEGSIHSAKVYRDPDFNEYQTHFFKEGKPLGEPSVHYTPDKDDAINTAKAEVDRMNVKFRANKK